MSDYGKRIVVHKNEGAEIARITSWMLEFIRKDFAYGEIRNLAESLLQETLNKASMYLAAADSEYGELPANARAVRLPDFLSRDGKAHTYYIPESELQFGFQFRTPVEEEFFIVSDPTMGDLIAHDLETAREMALAALESSVMCVPDGVAPSDAMAKARYRIRNATRSVSIETQDGAIGFERARGFEIDPFLRDVVVALEHGLFEDMQESCDYASREQIDDAKAYLEFLERAFDTTIDIECVVGDTYGGGIWVRTDK